MAIETTSWGPQDLANLTNRMWFTVGFLAAGYLATWPIALLTRHRVTEHGNWTSPINAGSMGKSIFKWVIILCHVWLPEGIECLWSCPCSLMLLTLCDHPIKLSQLMRTPNMLSSCDISDVVLCYTHKKWLVDILPTNKTMKRCFMVGCISVVLPHMF